MYKVRIEHAGYDNTPFEFEREYEAMDFIKSLMPAKNMGEKRTVTFWEEDDQEKK